MTQSNVFSLDFLIFSLVTEELLYMLFSLVQWQRRGNLSKDTELLLSSLHFYTKNSTASPRYLQFCLIYYLFIKDSSAPFCFMGMTSSSFDYFNTDNDSWKTFL